MFFQWAQVYIPSLLIMAVAFFQTTHCPQLVATLVHALEQNSQFVGRCTFWSGPTDKDGYGFRRMVYESKRLRLHVHRLAYFLSDPTQKLNPQYHVSHLCHNKLCIKVLHSSYEPAMVNNARKICKGGGECLGHR